MGAGRTELLETRRRPPAASNPAGSCWRAADVSGIDSPSASRDGLVLVPEDRQRDGLVQTMSVGQNLSLASIAPSPRRPLHLAQGARRRWSATRSARSRSRPMAADAAIGSLSGGNQQKVVIGKMLATNPQVILLDEPSARHRHRRQGRGVQAAGRGRETGLAVVYTTSEVGECLSDRASHHRHA
jgi:erythritol transport system ATP-binding protein